MKTEQDNINEWLRNEAHVVPGHAFRKDDLSCLPVWPENKADVTTEAPQGFLVTLGDAVSYMDAHSPEGEQMVGTWVKYNMVELQQNTHALPAECWYG